MDADQAIVEVMDRATEYASARDAELELEDERAGEKQSAIRRVMESGDNPLTGKAHSASSAEAVVETDASYADYKRKQRDATVRTIMTRARYEAAKYRAQLLVSVAEVAA